MRISRTACDRRTFHSSHIPPVKAAVKKKLLMDFCRALWVSVSNVPNRFEMSMVCSYFRHVVHHWLGQYEPSLCPTFSRWSQIRCWLYEVELGVDTRHRVRVLHYSLEFLCPRILLAISVRVRVCREGQRPLATCLPRTGHFVAGYSATSNSLRIPRTPATNLDHLRTAMDLFTYIHMLEQKRQTTVNWIPQGSPGPVASYAWEGPTLVLYVVYSRGLCSRLGLLRACISWWCQSQIGMISSHRELWDLGY